MRLRGQVRSATADSILVNALTAPDVTRRTAANRRGPHSPRSEPPSDRPDLPSTCVSCTFPGPALCAACAQWLSGDHDIDARGMALLLGAVVHRATGDLQRRNETFDVLKSHGHRTYLRRPVICEVGHDHRAAKCAASFLHHAKAAYRRTGSTVGTALELIVR